MLVLIFEEFNNDFGIDNKAMSYVRIKDIGKDISITPIEIKMRDETPLTINGNDFNIIVNLHPTDGTHWVLVMRREGGNFYYFDSFGVETPPLFLKECVDLGSNERIQEYDESNRGAYCLYMIYVIDRRFIIEGALDVLVNQIKCPGMYDKCFCFSCKVKGNVEDKVEDGKASAKPFHGWSETHKDTVNDNVNDKEKVDDSQGTCFADGNGNNKVNRGTCFAAIAIVIVIVMQMLKNS